MNSRENKMIYRGGPKYVFCLLFLCFFAFSASFSQDSKIVQDSLRIEELTEELRNSFRARELDNAWLIVEEIKEIAAKANMPVKIADCHANFALIERARGNNTSSISYYQQAARQYEQQQRPGLAARSYTAAGQIYIAKQMYGPALQEFSRSLLLREQLGDSLGMANNLINLGGAAYYAGWLDDSSDYYYRALRITDALEEKSLKAQILMNISNIHTRQNNYVKAKDYLLQALQLRQQQEDIKGESEVLLNLGIVYYEMKDLELAQSSYERSLEIKQTLANELPGITKLYNNLGLVAKELDDEQTAIYYFNKAAENAALTGDTQTKAAAFNNLGSIMIDKDVEKAIGYLQQSLEKTQRLGLRKQMISNYDNLQQAYLSKGNYEMAYEYMRLFKSLSDSLYNLESAARIAELQTQYDTEIKEKENQLLRQQGRSMRLRFMMASLSAIAAAILAVSFIIMFNLKRKSLSQSRSLLLAQTELNRVEREKSLEKERHLQEVLFAEEEINRLQKQQLDEKSRELTTSTLAIIGKNEVLNKVKQKANKALESDECEGKVCIEQLIGEIDGNINLDEQWDHFKKHFESVHAGFFSRLREKYPGLTQNELKLCAYLRMNLSSKEIAQMLNIEVESAITKRYRLRKKMKLHSDDNLVSFLIDF